MSEEILKYLRSVGGDRRTCCAYTPEIMAFIERLWGIIHSMASAMMIDKKLDECYWELAQMYALDIYKNVPPSRMKNEHISCHTEPNLVFLLHSN